MAVEVTASVLVCSFLMVAALLVAYMTKKYKMVFVPESATAMFLGMIFGAFSRVLNLTLGFSFSPEVFFYGLLPIIILNAGYSLKKKDFFRNFNTIILFAVVGTIISAIVYGLGTYALYQWGYIKIMSTTSPLLEAMMFGSLISAIDPVGTLAILQDVQAPPVLYNLVFGESLVNDASSIVLFRTFASFVDTEFSFSTIGIALLWFCAISVGSIVLGVLTSLGCALALKYIDIHSEYAKFELSFILLSAYISYAIAEIMGLSGIMSLFFCGICNAHYGYYNTSHATKISSKYAFEGLSYLSELFVFAYLGMQVVVLDHVVDWGLIWSAIPLCLLSRAFNVFPLSWLANLKRSVPITRNMQVMMWVSGLRGAIAYALSVNMPTDNRAMETTTLFVVVFTTVVFGGMTSPTLSFLGLINGMTPAGHDEAAMDVPLIANQSLYEPGRGLMELAEQQGGQSGFHRAFRWVDNTYMKPIFGGQVERGLQIGSFADEDEGNNEAGGVVWVEHLGMGFSIHAPEDWEERHDIDLGDELLAKLESPELADGEDLPAATITVTLHVDEGASLDIYGEPIEFLTHMWDKLDLGGVNALPKEVKRVLKRMGSSKLQREDSKTSKRMVGSTLPRGPSFVLSSHNHPENDPAGLVPAGYKPALSSKPLSGENVDIEADSKAVEDKIRQANVAFPKSSTTTTIPAFVMWARHVHGLDGHKYYHYEVVLHPEDHDMQRAHVRHLLLSVAGYAGAFYVCRIDATEKWLAENEATVGMLILESFKVGGDSKEP